MFVVIAGCGRLGAGLARVLSSTGHDVAVIGDDIDPRRLGADFDGVTVTGRPIDEDALGRAGIGKADLFVAATADDRLNAMAAQVAREIFRTPYVIARISDPEMEGFYRELGLDTVCPTSTAINQILDKIQGAAFRSLRGRLDPDIAAVRPPREWLGLAMGELDLADDRVVVGIVADGAVSARDPERRIGPSDVLILARRRREGGSR